MPPTTTRPKDDAALRIARALIAARQRHNVEAPGVAFTLGAAAEVIRAQLAIEYPVAKKTLKVAGRDVLFDAIATATGKDLTCLGRNEAATVATAKRDILEASPNVTAAEIARRAAAYRKKYRDAACTPMALANHWSEFGQAPAPLKAAKRVFSEANPPDGPTWRHAVRYSRDYDLPSGFDIPAVCQCDDWAQLPAPVRTTLLAYFNR